MTFYKLAVVWLWIIDALHCALIVYGIYDHLVTNYANIPALQEIIWSAKLQVPVEIFIAWSVNLLYVHRIWIVSKGRSRALPIIVSILVVLGSGVAISLIWELYQCHVFADLIRIDWAIYSTLGTTTFLDILIASSLCYLLATSRTGYSNTDFFVTKLMGYTISTGCLTSIFSLMTIITFAAMPRNFIYLGVKNLEATSYVNSYIALLNARYYLQANADIIDSSEFHKPHGVSRSELRISASDSQDNKYPAHRKTVFEQLDDGVLHLTRPAEVAMRPIAATMEVDYFSSV
ncbi:hypothetical protein DEU56DRAFT_788260 [Suillus clintonianus]|uniref:uncharacterized protein n=1 Tax=Suillus clintonianus TaxID=1904413 RepID=UPI001B86A5A6|nr:uncharacterized protein DEU56DRAFT_788260 [Suillus clintonianus]KAG2145825.1 hypothetical protein DEU56DRAFT_788260 [Suillus clintonianus]